MSFILDALKKSESDRQRQSGPSLFEVKVAPPRRKLPVWAVAITVLLAINVIVISWILFRHAPAHQPAVATPPAVSPPAATPAKTLGESHSAGGSAPANVTANAAPAANSLPARAAAPAASSATSQATTSQGATSKAGSDQIPAAPLSGPTAQSAGLPSAAIGSSDNAPAVDPAAAQGSGSSTGTAALPIYQQIVTSAGLPALHLDLHVYAENPKDRFVMINMHRLGEGDSLPDGVRVERIRPDGVVLSYHGTRFLLPRD